MYKSNFHLRTSILLILLSLLAPSSNTQASDANYCDLFDSTTKSGKEVTGVCYMYSDQFGVLEDAETESGEEAQRVQIKRND